MPRGRLAAVALLILVAVAGCDWLRPPDDDPPADDLYDIRSSGPVAAGWVTLSHGSGELVSAVALRDGMVVRAVTNGNMTRVAWVSSVALPGRQVQIGFNVASSGWSTPQVIDSTAYRSSTEALAGGSILLTSASPTSGSPAALALAPLTVPQADDDAIEAAFADFRLGDVNASGDLSILDAMLLVEMTKGASSTPRARYLADLNGDYSVGTADVVTLLEKLTDPALPARLVVKPARVPFVRLDASTAGAAVVLLGNGGNAPLSGVSWSNPGVSVGESWKVAGQSAVLSLGEPANGSWLPNVMSVSGPGGSWPVSVGHLVILIAGQSNAVGRGANLAGWPETNQNDPNVRMLGNDYRWKNASEPLDLGTGQLDSVSFDSTVLYSFGTRLGNLLNGALGFTTYLIPAAKGGSCLWNCGEPPGDTGSWAMSVSHLNRSSLLGSANFRAQVAAGLQTNPGTGNVHPAESGPVNLVVWYQGESENLSDERSQYKGRTLDVFNSFGAQQFAGAGSARVVLVQLASNAEADENVIQNDIAERQRQLERENGNIVMVVAHDLPRSDHIHLSAHAQRVLAERISLAVRQHVFGEDVDGTGPRPLSISSSGNQVRIKVDMPLVVGNLDASMFTVYDGVPSGSIDDVELYGLNSVTITSAVVAAGDPTTIVLTLVSAAPATPFVRHMPPPGRPHHTSVWTEIAPNMARAAASELPLAQFGPRASF